MESTTLLQDVMNTTSNFTITTAIPEPESTWLQWIAAIVLMVAVYAVVSIRGRFALYNQFKKLQMEMIQRESYIPLTSDSPTLLLRNNSSSSSQDEQDREIQIFVQVHRPDEPSDENEITTEL